MQHLMVIGWRGMRHRQILPPICAFTNTSVNTVSAVSGNHRHLDVTSAVFFCHIKSYNKVVKKEEIILLNHATPNKPTVTVSLRSQQFQMVFQCSICLATMTILYPKT